MPINMKQTYETCKPLFSKEGRVVAKLSIYVTPSNGFLGHHLVHGSLNLPFEVQGLNGSDRRQELKFLSPLTHISAANSIPGECMDRATHLQQLLDTPCAPLVNWREIVTEINNEFHSAETEGKRVALLGVFKATMDIVEKRIAPEDVEPFRETTNK